MSLKSGVRFGVLTAALLSLLLNLSGCAGVAEKTSKAPAVSNGIDPTRLSPGGTTSAFYIDSVNAKSWKPGEVYVVEQGGVVVVSGWGFDIKNGRPALGIFVGVDGRGDRLVNYGEERRDVADFFKNEGYLKTGFTVAVPTANLSKGKHKLNFKIVSADNTEYFVPVDKVEIDCR